MFKVEMCLQSALIQDLYNVSVCGITSQNSQWKLLWSCKEKCSSTQTTRFKCQLSPKAKMQIDETLWERLCFNSLRIIPHCLSPHSLSYYSHLRSPYALALTLQGCCVCTCPRNPRWAVTLHSARLPCAPSHVPLLQFSSFINGLCVLATD